MALLESIVWILFYVAVIAVLLFLIGSLVAVAALGIRGFIEEWSGDEGR